MTRGDYSEAYHTYGMEWSDSYIYTWVDSRLAVSLSIYWVSHIVDDKTVAINICPFWQEAWHYVRKRKVFHHERERIHPSEHTLTLKIRLS